MQLCYEARKRLLFVLWDGIVFEDILYQMGRIRDTFIYGAAGHELSGGGNTGAWVSLIVKVVVSKNIYFFIRAGYQILFCT